MAADKEKSNSFPLNFREDLGQALSGRGQDALNTIIAGLDRVGLTAERLDGFFGIFKPESEVIIGTGRVNESAVAHSAPSVRTTVMGENSEQTLSPDKLPPELKIVIAAAFKGLVEHQPMSDNVIGLVAHPEVQSQAVGGVKTLAQEQSASKPFAGGAGSFA